MITTIHGFSSPDIVPVYAKYNHSTFFVAISDADRHPALDYRGHHPSRDRHRRIHLQPGAWLLFGVLRTHSPRQGGRCGHRRRNRGGNPASDRRNHSGPDVLRERGRPRLDQKRVQFIGSVQAEDRSSFLGGAVALLHLIDFDEPFGLSVVEAMACGTPVIAFDRGSMSELIVEGTTGSVVIDVQSAATAVMGIARFDRATVRAVSVQRFSSDRMVDEYVTAYGRAISESKRTGSPSR